MAGKKDGAPVDPKFTDEAWLTRFLDMVHIGLPPYRAAEACGLTRMAYFKWARKGGHPDFTESQDWVPPDQADPLYRDFVVKVLEAEASSIRALTQVVHQKAAEDGDFGLKVLRHRYPEDWNPNRNKAPTVIVQEAPAVQVDYETLMKAREKLAGEGDGDGE